MSVSSWVCVSVRVFLAAELTVGIGAFRFVEGGHIKSLIKCMVQKRLDNSDINMSGTREN